MTARRQGTSRREHTAARGVNGRAVALYVYQGDQLHDPDAPEDPLCGDKRGTYAGWNVHKRNGEEPCEDCRHAQAEYVAEWRLRTGRVKSRRVAVAPAELALRREAIGVGIRLREADR
jgi:hypothetical protein